MQQGEANKIGRGVEEQSEKETPDTNQLSVTAEKSMFWENEMQKN